MMSFITEPEEGIENDTSYSVFIENKDLEIERLLNNKSNDNSYINYGGRKIMTWVKDESINNCFGCNKQFSFFIRKHHCRGCGRIFCNDCSNNFILLPREVEVFPMEPENDSFKKYVQYWVNGNSGCNLNRVCNICRDKYNQEDKLWLYISVIRILDLDLRVMNKISLINKKFRKAISYCKLNLREIQYYLPKHKLTKYEKKFLWMNRNYFAGHSKWLVQLVKSIDWSDFDKANIILELLTREKEIRCLNLLCSRHCKKKIYVSDAIELLYINNIHLKKFLIHCISLIDYDDLLNYLQLIVNNIKYDMENDLIIDFLIKRSIENSEIRFRLYWILTLKIKDEIFGNHYLCIRSKFIKNIQKNVSLDDVLKLLDGYKFVELISNININGEFRELLKSTIKQNNIFKNRFELPLDPNYIVLNIDVENIIIKKSATNPVVIPVICEKDGKEVIKKILFKIDDIRKDEIVINMIRLMDNILKKELNIDLFILTYNVIPINERSGIIEIVPDSITLYDIKYKKKMSLLNYLLENNKKETIEEIRSRFVKSTAAYCVITYLLGIGDRHLENIMVTKNGILFHIDYGFILGNDPKKSLAPYMRITEDMVEALGGENSKFYKDFQECCNLCYNCLRRYYNLFMSMFLLLNDASPAIEDKNIKFSYDQLRNEINSRFLPGQLSKEAEMHLINKINSSKSNSNSSIIDILHYYGKGFLA